MLSFNIIVLKQNIHQLMEELLSKYQLEAVLGSIVYYIQLEPPQVLEKLLALKPKNKLLLK
jgi:hypothetical protein